MWRNNGNGTFAEVGRGARPGRRGRNVAAVGTDFNNDRAIDLVVTGGVHPLVWINPREGAIQGARLAGRPDVTDHRRRRDRLRQGRVDGPGVHPRGRAGTVALAQPGRQAHRAGRASRSEDAGGWGLAPIDYDNDGWVDLVAAGSGTPGAAGLVVLRNDAGRFTDASGATGAGR